MSTHRKSLFGCPVCGFRVTGNEEACPRCGTSYGKGTKFECPFCGMIVDPRLPKCPGCHVSYEEFVERASRMASDDSVDTLLTEIISTEAQQVKEEDKRLSCPQCSWMLDGTEEKCPKCGASFSEDMCYQCPICAALVRFDAPRCVECGTLFSQDGAQVEADVAEALPEEQVPEEVSDSAPMLPEHAHAAELPEQKAPELQPAPVEEPRPEVQAPPAVAEGPPAEKTPEEELPEKKTKQRKLKTRKVKAKPS